MSTIQDLKPSSFFNYFAEISAIPRGSYHEKAISDHLVQFAQQRNLSVTQDELGSVLIRKPGTAGYEDAAPVVFHGHMDMVLAKDESVEQDMLSEGVRLQLDGDFISGAGTTLGADNGVGVAYMMAVLDSTDIAHPPIQAIITVQEEVGKAGALAFDVDEVTGRRLIDFNWHNPETIFAGCAGDISAWFELPVDREEPSLDGARLDLIVHGLEGGHSEFDIHLERANAIVILGRLLETASRTAPTVLVNATAGVNRYVIPNSAEASIVVARGDVEAVQSALTQLSSAIAHEYVTSDPSLAISVTENDIAASNVVTAASTRRLAIALTLLPNGVQSMSLTRPGLVESSNTIAILELTDDKARLLSTIPSAVSSRKYAILQRLHNLAELLGAGTSVSTFADCPEWPFKQDSPLLATAVDAYRALYGTEPEIEVSHSSLELGIFSKKLPGVEMISLGPEAFDVHTTRERLNHTTVQHVWDHLVEILRRLTN